MYNRVIVLVHHALKGANGLSSRGLFNYKFNSLVEVHKIRVPFTFDDFLEIRSATLENKRAFSMLLIYLPRALVLKWEWQYFS